MHNYRFGLRTNRSVRMWFVLLLALSLPLLLLITGLRQAHSQEDMLAELRRNVQRAGSYAFNADITQYTVPVASVYSVGDTSQRQDMRMQGATDLRNNAFHMTLWSEGGNILDLGTGIEIQAKDGKTLARQSGEAWQEIGAMSPSVMPQGDFLTFLTAATNVEKQGEETRNGVNFTRYTFQIDGKAFAQIVRQRTEAELRSAGSLAPDRTLSLSPLMVEMTGDGELWVTRDEAGRAWPLRQLVQLRFPAQDGVWSSASISVNFHDFGAEPALLLPSLPALSPWLDVFWRFLPFFLTGALTGGLLLLVIVHRQSRLVYKALALACIASMLAAPLLQSVYAAQADERLYAQQARETARQQEMQAIQDLMTRQDSVQNSANLSSLEMIRRDNGLDGDGDGVTDVQEAVIGSNPMAASEDHYLLESMVGALQAADPNLDSDGDGLKDQEEILLGTRPDAADSDGDSITDTLEIRGFAWGGRQWYSNPLEQDSNNDGVPDTNEWNSPDLPNATWDTNNNGVPDIADRDNDGDGVPDAYDLSPFAAPTETYGADAPLQLALTGMTPGKTVFVDYQVRPTNADRLWYAFSALDWPTDSAGAFKDIDKSTEDVSLTPMLEILLSKPPYHLPLTTPSVSVPIRGVQEPGGGFSPTLPLAPVAGSLTLTQSGDNVEVNGNLSRPAFLSVHRGTCVAVGGVVGPVLSVTTTGNGSIVPLSLNGQKLADLARGGFSIWITEQANNGLLLGCGEIPAVPFVGDQMVDRSALQPYQISVRDVSRDGLVKALYAPLQLVVDKEGGARVAFGAQIPFLVQAGGEGLSQQVRMVWSVQMKNDDVCVSSRLKPIDNNVAYECAETQNNVPQVIYSYPETWRLTGLDLREDHSVTLAQIYEDPAVDNNLNSDNLLSALASDLGNSFVAGRVTDAGVRDVTVAEIARRFDRSNNGAVSEEERWGIPNNLRVITSTYPTLDQMTVGSIRAAKSILDSSFTSSWSPSQPITPTLLNAFEWHFRAFNLDALGKDNSIAYNAADRRISLDWTASPVITKNTIKWLPYAYQNGAWNDLNIADYWDELKVRLQPEFADESDPKVAGGKIIAVQLYYLALFNGVGATVQVGSKVFDRIDAKRDADLLLGKAAAGGLSAFGKFVLGKHILGVFTGPLIWGNTSFALFKALYDMIEGIYDLTDTSGSYLARQFLLKGSVIAGLKGGGILLGIGAAIAVVAGAALFLGDKLTGGTGTAFIKPAVMIVLAAVALLGAKSALTDTLTVVKATIKIAKSGADALKGAKVLSFALSKANLKAGAITGAIGLIIEVGLLWGYVLYSAIWGDVAQGNLDLGLLLAFAVAATIVAVLYAAIGAIPIVGQIIVALLGLLDAIFAAACAIEDAIVAKNPELANAPRKIPRTPGGQCFGISTWLTENLVPAFYQKDTVFDLSSPLVREGRRFPQLSNFNISFADATAGAVAGNQMRYQARLGGALGPSMPKSAVQSAYEPENLLTTRYYAELSSQPRADITGTVATTQALPLNWSSIQLVLPPLRFTQFSFVGQYSFDFDRYIITLDDRLLESAPISLTHAGVNVPFDLYFNFALKLPVYECTVGFCFYVDKFSTSGNSTRMNGLEMDILPATIGEFYARNWGTWTQDGKTMGVPFPAAADFDNDGLKAAPSGLDPNDATWDTDGDGLSDGFELSPKDAQTARTLAYRFNPNARDGDNDGLCDADELRLRTNPALADTDGDGLSDGAEVYHLNCQSGQWEGGWLFTYNVTDTLTTRINSDPLSYDGDGDGMSDKAEKDLHAANPAAYPFHPGVFNVSPLGFYAISSDFDRYVATGSTLVFSTTLRNNFTTGDRRAQGSILRSSGAGLGNLSQTGVYTLFPNNEVTFVDTVTAVGGSARIAISNSIAAEFLTLEQAATGTPSYQVQIPYALTIDADKPTSSLTSGTHVQAGGFRIIGGVAQDPTSPIARVDVRIVGQTDFTAAEGSHGWAYTWQVPTSEGARTIQTRATDVVGYVEDPVNSVQVIVDGTPPQLATTQTGNPIVSARRNAAGQWVLTLSGTVTDPLSGGAAGSGVASVEVDVTPRSSGWHSATVSGGQWQIEYALSNLDSDNNFNGDATGQYTVFVRAADKVNNQTPANSYLNYPLRVDTTAPRALLSSLTEEVTNGNAVAITQTLFITRSLVLTGTVTDPGEFAAGVQSAEIAFVPAELLDGLGAPSLLLYLNEAEEISTYVNAAPGGTPAQCNGSSCPVNDVTGIYGGAAQFDGANDVITAPVDIPESGLTVSLWFNTTNPNGGLFAATAGNVGSAGDRSIYLTNGNLCAYVKGAQEDEICTSGTLYNDGQWHQAVLVVDGTTPFRLYVDGNLGAAAGTVNSSTLTAQSSVAVGYARTRTGGNVYFNGRIDEVEVYPSGFDAAGVASLYRRWQPVTLANGGAGVINTTWRYTVPTGLEGLYQIDLRAADVVGNRNDNARGDWRQWRGQIDTAAPRVQVSSRYVGTPGSGAQTLYTITAEDFNLSREGYVGPCEIKEDDYRYDTSPFWAVASNNQQRLDGFSSTCAVNGWPVWGEEVSYTTVTACDIFGNCTQVTENRDVLYWSTVRNATGVSGVRRANQNGGFEREELFNNRNRITGLDVDPDRGHIYWLEQATSNSGRVVRANLDGSNVVTLTIAPAPVMSSSVTFPATFDLVVNPAGGKLYWSEENRIKWANLDGSAAATLFTLPTGNDPRVDRIGRMVVDRTGGKIYFAAIDLATNSGDALAATGDSQIWVMNADGTNPQVLIDRAALQNVVVIDLTLTSDRSRLYWTQRTRLDGRASSGTGMRRVPVSGGAPSTVNVTQAANVSFIGMLALSAADSYAYLSQASLINQVNLADDSSSFFAAEEPLHLISAAAIATIPGLVSNQSDLALETTLAGDVAVTGGTLTYSLIVRNNGPVRAVNVTVVNTLPANTTFVPGGSSPGCSAAASQVTCVIDQLADGGERTLTIQLQVNAAAGSSLAAGATVSSGQSDPKPENNNVTFAAVQVLPVATAAPATARYLYWGDDDLLYRKRVDVAGSREIVVGFPQALTNQVIRGVAVDTVNNRVYWSSAPWDESSSAGYIRRANLDGSGLTTIYTDTAAPWPGALAIHPTNGHLYFNLGDAIRRVNLDGSGETTAISGLVNNKGLGINPLRNEIYWSDQSGLLRRANLDGSNAQTITSNVYAYDLVVDPYADRIYFRTVNDRAIFRIQRNGADLTTLVLGTGAHGPALDIANDALYWVDGAVVGNLSRAKLDGSNSTAQGDTSGRPSSQLAIAYTNAVIAPTPTPSPTPTPIPASTPTPIPTPVPGGLPAAERIYWSNNDGEILRAPIAGCADGACIEVVLTPSAGTSAGDLVVDSLRSAIYWVNPVNNRIQRAGLNGANPTILVDNLSDPTGITLDERNGLLYWTNYNTGTIQRANVDGSNVITLVTGLTQPVWIDLAPNAGQLYFIESNQIQDNRDDRKIRRVNVDGTGLVDFFVSWPGNPADIDLGFEITGLSVNESLGRIYWSDADIIDAFSGAIRWISLNGDDAGDLVFDGGRTPRGVRSDVNSFNLYWSTHDDLPGDGVLPTLIQRSFAEGPISGQPITALIQNMNNSEAKEPFDLALQYPTPTPVSCPADVYEPDNAFNDPTALTVGTASVNHNFHTGGDVDWYAVTLAGGLRYVIAAQAAGSQADTLLELYAANGTTLLAADDNGGGLVDSRITYDAGVDGVHYLKVTNQRAAAVTACDSGYEVRVNLAEVTAPARLPNLAPVNHTPGVLGSTIITPADGALLTSVGATALAGGSFTSTAPITALTVTVNGVALPVVNSFSAGGNWSTTWTPGAEGAYRLESRVRDAAGGVQTNTYPITVFVDLAAPGLSVDRTVFTQTHLLADTQLGISGGITESGGMGSVELKIGNDAWRTAVITGSRWLLPWSVAAELADSTLPALIRATDRAGRTTTITRTFVLDGVAPQMGAVAVNQAGNSRSVERAVALNQTLIISWTAAVDANGVAGYYAGFTTSPTPNLGALTFYNGAGSHSQSIGEAQVVYGHVVVVDTFGNQTVRSVGPLTVDSPETPDFIADLNNTSWLTTGGSHLSTDWEVSRGLFAGASFGAAQKFFATWNNQALRLAWSGANWNGDGDLFIYLDTAAGGATTLYNPFATPAAITLPAGMTANFVVWVKDAATAQLYQSNGGAWTLVSTLGGANFRADAALTDLLLPFSLLGLSNASSLQIVAVASEEGALKLWAASPDKNPLNSERAINPAAATRNLSNYGLTLSHAWASLALGQIPNAGLAPDSDLVLTIAANVDAGGAGFLNSDLLDLLQPGQTLDANGDGVADVALPGGAQAASVGNGDSIGYTIQYANRGSATARGVTLALAGLGGLSINPTLNLGDVAPGASGTVQVTATVNGAVNGVELQAQVSDTAHGVYDWFWFVHPVDTQTPTDVAVATPAQYAGSGKQLVVGEAKDASPLAGVTVTVNGVQTTCPIGNGSSTLWSCLADFGNLGAANSVNIQVQVTDIHGNTSAPATFAMTVDNTPPVVTFDAATEEALADGFLSAGEDRLAGLVNDNFEAVSLEFCAVAENGYVECANIDTQPLGSAAGNWSRRIPLGESDGVTQTLRFTGSDGAGNRSTPVTRTFQLDTVSPVVTATLGAEGISGVVSDGGGIGSVRLRVEPPTGAPYWVDATRNGSQWSLIFTNAAAGVYTLYVEATDRAGNRAAAGPFTLTVTNGGSESTIYLPVVVYEESKEPPTYLPLITR